jgi:hypothetical protein
MAAFRAMTTTVLEPTVLKTIELEEYESWVLNQLPEYYRLAKGDDRLPLEDLIDSDLLECICVDLGITTDEFNAIGKTAALPRGDDKLKFAQLDRAVCPFLDQHAALVAIRKIKMSPTGPLITSFMQYNKRFKFWIRIVSAPALSRKLVSKPHLKDVVKVYAENFFPMGKGPKSCIGQYFAMTEMKPILIEFIRNFFVLRKSSIKCITMKTKWDIAQQPVLEENVALLPIKNIIFVYGYSILLFVSG